MELKLSDGFFDLCVHFNEDLNNVSSMLLRLYKLGYKTVAINQIVKDKVLRSAKKKKKKGEECEVTTSPLPEPIKLNDLPDELKGKLKIFNRITFECSDPNTTHLLAHSRQLRKYDLYAIVPQTQAALQFACSQVNADLILINSLCSGLKINRKLYRQATERGLHFEINYVDFINPETRKAALYYSHLFYMYGRSKNIVVSSGAINETSIRDPYDIINLLSLAGLNEVKAKASILSQCKSLLLAAERRRYGKAIFTIELSTKRTDDDNETNKEFSPLKRIKL